MRFIKYDLIGQHSIDEKQLPNYLNSASYVFFFFFWCFFGLFVCVYMCVYIVLRSFIAPTLLFFFFSSQNKKGKTYHTIFLFMFHKIFSIKSNCFLFFMHLYNLFCSPSFVFVFVCSLSIYLYYFHLLPFSLPPFSFSHALIIVLLFYPHFMFCFFF